MRIRLHLILAILAYVAVSRSAAQESEEAPSKRESMARAFVGGFSVEIVRERVTSSVAAIELVPTSYRSAKVEPAPGNVAFLGTVRTKDAESLGWVAYDSIDEDSFPRPVWSADVAWEPRRKEVLVALTRTVGPRLRVDIHRVEVRGNRDVPARLDGSDHRTWPAAARPIASFESDRGTERLGDIGRVMLVTERSGLLVVLERSPPDDRPLYLRFTWNTKAWTWVKLIEDPAEVKK